MGAPIFIIGRQHSGNTMLAWCLGRAPEVHSLTGEGQFFEHQALLEDKSIDEKITSVISLVDQSGGEIPEEARPELQNYMRASGDKVGRQTVGGMYARCMAWLAEQQGATRWAQKATSYIFHVDAILECFPDARLVFLVRNPLDLAASMKRRGGWSSVARMTYGWNKGVQLALRYADRQAGQFLIVRYERFVEESRRKMGEVCDFCDLPFRESYLEVPHVNRSESPYNQSSTTESVSSSRLGYYQNVLNDTEIGAVRTLVEDRLVETLYPDHLRKTETSLSAASYAVGLALSGSARVIQEHAVTLLRDPNHTIQRIKKRLLA